MKNNKSLYGKFIAIFFVLMLVSYGVSFVWANYRILRNHDSIGTSDIGYEKIDYEGMALEDNKLVSKNENPSLKFTFDQPQYINKIIFNANSDLNVKWTIDMISYDIYGNQEIVNIDGVLNHHVDIFSEKINKRVSEFKINFDGEVSLDNFKIDNNLDYISKSFLLMFISFETVFIIIFFRKRFVNHIEELFATLVLAFGILFLNFLPIVTGISYDDQIHYANTYSIFNEYYSNAALELTDPISNNFKSFNTTEEYNQYLKVLNDRNKELSDTKSNQVFGYNFISYLPSGILMKVCDLAGVDFAIQLALAKIINYLIYAVIMFFAIKFIPKFKYLLCCIGLIPTSLFLAASFSYDPPITAFVFLGLAFYFKEIFSKNTRLNSFNVFVMVISFSIATLIKISYCPFMLLLLTFPSSKFKDKRSRVYFSLMVLFLTFLDGLSFILPVVNGTITSDVRGGATSISGQLSTIIHSPISFLRVFVNNAGGFFFDKFFSQGTYTFLAYVGAIKSNNIYYLFLILLISSLFLDNDKEDFDVVTRVSLIITTFLCICLIWGALYVSFTPVGSLTINGVQNRYFIPLLFPFLLIFSTNKVKLNFNKSNIFLVFSSCIFLVLFFIIVGSTISLIA